jgi:protein TonB
MDEQRKRIGWIVSVVFHICVLVWATAWLVQPARFHVEPGKTSTEIEFSVQPVAVPEVSLPQPAIPPAPVPTPPPITVPDPVKREMAVAPEPLAVSPPPAIPAPSKVQDAKPSPKPKPVTHKETTSASKGAVQAEPDALHNEPPEYPEDSRAAREQGVVILRVEVTAYGTPAEINILKSSGYFRLDQAARRAVQHWKFTPALAAGIAVASEADVPVRFKLQ